MKADVTRLSKVRWSEVTGEDLRLIAIYRDPPAARLKRKPKKPKKKE
jgi:hypothetical protein